MENIIFKRLDEDTLKTIKEPIILNEEIYNKKQLEKFINNKNNYAFVGIHEDEVIAFLYGYGMVRPDGKSMFYIHSVDVASNYQNNGIGTKLMEYVIAYIKEEQLYYKFFVLTEDDNIRACKVYQKYADKEQQVLFSKKL
ncbi:MAG: GNAT family N-acetyltransferase [Clostridia bacterium]|nr:GNAT family N-acetyltransferase [Clostridia bacterium]